MIEMENRILSLLASGYKIDNVIKELNIEKEMLADVIIELDIKGLIDLNDKEWILTQKGNEVLQKMKELLKDIKLEYMYGNISREEFWEKRKELETIVMVEKPKQDSIKEKHIKCPKCGKDNRSESKYCYKCGIPLIDVQAVV